MKDILKRIFVVAIFIIVAILLIKVAPAYELTYKYKNGDLRVIIDDVEITRDIKKLPEVAVLLNGEVLLSQSTVDILFDKDLYYEEKYDTLITTSEEHRANIKIDSKTIEIDGAEIGVKVPAVKNKYDYSTDDRYEGMSSIPQSKDIIYIPIKELSLVYDIDVSFDDKLIITHRNSDLSKIVINDSKYIDVKYLKDDNSKTIKKVKENDYIEIFNFDDDEEYNLVRCSDGEIGYARTDELSRYNLETVYKKAEKEEMPKVKMAWDYINPDNGTIGDKATRSKIKNLDVVAPTLLFLQNTDGEVLYKINLVKEYLDWAKSKGYKVWVTFKNESFKIEDTSTFLNDMKHRNTCINELVEFAKKYNVDGINIDFENMYKEDAETFSQFIRELAVETRKENLVLSVCVNVPDGSDTWSLCYQHKKLSESADYIALMAYDESKAKVGSFASYNWVINNVEKLVQRDGVDGEKLILGISFDSAYWKITNDKPVRSVYYMNSAKKYLNNATWNDTAKQYYYENTSKNECIYIEEKTSIKEKLKLIDDYDLAGFACWCLGQETEDVWEVFDI